MLGSDCSLSPCVIAFIASFPVVISFGVSLLSSFLFSLVVFTSCVCLALFFSTVIVCAALISFTYVLLSMLSVPLCQHVLYMFCFVFPRVVSYFSGSVFLILICICPFCFGLLFGLILAFTPAWPIFTWVYRLFLVIN